VLFILLKCIGYHIFRVLFIGTQNHSLIFSKSSENDIPYDSDPGRLEITA